MSEHQERMGGMPPREVLPALSPPQVVALQDALLSQR